jgi:hypothetical protein
MHLSVFVVGAVLAAWPSCIARLAGHPAGISRRTVRSVGLALMLLIVTAGALIA